MQRGARQRRGTVGGSKTRRRANSIGSGAPWRAGDARSCPGNAVCSVVVGVWCGSVRVRGGVYCVVYSKARRYGR